MTTSLLIRLDFPLNHVKDPVLYHLVKDYHLVPNIHSASIHAHEGGSLEIEVTGIQTDIDAGIAYLNGLGIMVAQL